MPFVARVAIELKQGFSDYENDKWYVIKKVNTIEYKFRLHKNLMIEVIAGVFVDKYDALKCAKTMFPALCYTSVVDNWQLKHPKLDFYVSRFFDSEKDNSIEEFMEKESFFFWTPDYVGCYTGVGVYEVANTINDFDDYNLFNIELAEYNSGHISLQHIDEYMFEYSNQSHEFLSLLLTAANASNIGVQMQIYCGILESLSEDGYKPKEITDEIDRLIKNVNDSSLSEKEKEQLIGYLENGKRKSARQKSKEIIKKYAKNQYGKYTSQQIFNDAYGIRSYVSHGGTKESYELRPASYMKFVVLDIVKNYLIEQEKKQFNSGIH